MKAAVLFAIALCSLVAWGGRSAEAAARTPLPWCLVPGDGEDAYFCNYYTFEQCRQAAKGNGVCERNPRFDAAFRQRGKVAPQDVDPRTYHVRPPDCWAIFCW